MTRTFFSAALILIVMGWAVADQPAPTAPQTLPPPQLMVSPGPEISAELSGRQKIEAILRAPANLDFGGRTSVTIQEVIDQLHEKHQLSIRMDVPTMTWSVLSLAAMDESPFAEMIGAPPAASPTDEAEVEAEATEPDANAPVKADAPKPLLSKSKANSPKAEPSDEDKEKKTAREIVSILMESLVKMPVNIRGVDLKNVSVATALRHALDAVPPSMISAELGLIVPMKITEASTLDYMVENDGLVITTRLNAQTIKETRVYSVKRIKDCKPEEISKVIRQAVRPWSWRSQINDLGEQMRVSAHGIPAQILTSVLQTGAQLVSAESGITVTANPCPDGECCPVSSNPGQPVVCTPTSASVSPPAPMPPTVYRPDGAPPAPVMAYPSAMPSAPAANSQQAIDALGDATVNAMITMAQASLSAMEMLHFADPPTGTIQVLPGKLIITQSQAAHREIAELLKELEE